MRLSGIVAAWLAPALIALAAPGASAQDSDPGSDGGAGSDETLLPPIVTVPESAPTEAEEEGPLGELLRGGGGVVAIATLGGGLAGALSTGALTFLSPCYCGLCGLSGLSLGAIATLLGATVGVGLARDWHCSQFWAPAMVAGAVGGVAGLIAGVVGVVVASATGATLNTRTYLLDVATGSALVSASASGGAACLTMGIGSLAAAAAATVVYAYQDSRERDRGDGRAVRALPAPDSGRARPAVERQEALAQAY
ncbi:MAG: hypothetical protein JXR83_12705 [Deltaproteobacteria bacterium]|nr:hypothetical protein [Deltaproteobacteria bacterium]